MWNEPKLSYLCKMEELARQRYIAVLKWVESLGFKLNGLILDVGCGRGFVSQLLSEIGCVPVGLDISTKFANSAFSKGITVVVGDVQNSPFKSKVFDAIVCFEVLEHLSNIEKALCAIHRLLKKRGLFISTMPLLHPINAIVDFIRGERTHINNLSKNVWLDLFKKYFDVAGTKTMFIPPIPPNLFKRYFLLNLELVNSHIWVCCIKR